MTPRPYAPPAKGGMWAWLWRGWVAWAFRRRFAALHLRAPAGMDALPGPVIFAANHCGWWDGFVAHLVMEILLGYDGYIPMEEKNLRRFPTMARAGAIPIDRDHPRRAMDALRWAAGALTAGPRRALWIFPQGALLPQDARPIAVEGGAAWVADAARAPVVPVAVRYELRDREKPEVFVSLGAPIPPEGGRREITAALGRALTGEVDRLAADVAADRFDRGRPAIAGAQGVDAWWEGLKARLRPRGRLNHGEG